MEGLEIKKSSSVSDKVVGILQLHIIYVMMVSRSYTAPGIQLCILRLRTASRARGNALFRYSSLSNITTRSQTVLYVTIQVPMQLSSSFRWNCTSGLRPHRLSVQSLSLEIKRPQIVE